MITINENQAVSVKVRLNQTNVVGSTITLTLDSPSRAQLVFSSVITNISNGLYSFPLDVTDTSQLIDDTYFYTISQDLVTLKQGVIRFVLDETINDSFDYILDFALA